LSFSVRAMRSPLVTRPSGERYSRRVRSLNTIR
jgi:hypothetical protein